MSKHYVTYFSDTVGYGNVDAVREFLNPVEDSEASPLGMVHYSTHKVVNGEIVEK